MNEMLLLHSVVCKKDNCRPLTECQRMVLSDPKDYADAVEQVAAEVRQLQPGETVTMIIPGGKGLAYKVRESVRRSV